MSCATVRGFQTASTRSVNWIGNVSVGDVVKMNNDSEWEKALTDAASKVETQNPPKLSMPRSSSSLSPWIESIDASPLTRHLTDDMPQGGALAHQSSKDKEEKEKIVTVGFYGVGGTRLLSSHVRRDGSYKSWESRAGKR
ncbi:hypothetical protein BDV26DRAFT_275566 [Aspergillus bertholletiae]|uniref:Uncharacterized protein n=1 Tax=Aspergillus bertholletiae TaxID=1226010 RepID=A0A5N7APB7_9EURO|nr:hypothetical protein BDV26DRAFT_275566 [Aspergillus bertholletiae]